MDARQPVTTVQRHGGAAVYLAFASTGLGLVMPGALLPLLLPLWSMQDARAGVLFFLFSAGSIAGALASRGNLRWSSVRGALAAAVGAIALGHATRGSALAAIAVYGFGLGVMMTSLSLMHSRRFRDGRAAQMIRLNLAWSMGACCGPWVVLRAAEAFGIQRTLRGIAVGFAVVAVGLLLSLREPVVAREDAPAMARGRMAAPLLLLCMVPLATGVESAMGAWIATYTRRAGQTFGVVIAESTCLWIGILLSRAVMSHERAARVMRRALLWACPALMLMSLTLLLLSQARGGMLAGALLLGAGAGPLYPAVLARVLRDGEGKNFAFAIAGAGSATLPLLAGVVSGRTGSLRMGLCVPLVAVAAMLMCGLVAREEV